LSKKRTSFPCKRESREVMRTCFVYLLASKRNVTLSIGVTNYDLG
jgi:hypothetical protein